MRLTRLLALAFSAAIAVPAARADNLLITITPTDGSQVLTFDFDPSNINSTSASYDIVYNMNGNTGTGSYNSILGLFNTDTFTADTGTPYNFGYIDPNGNEFDYAGSQLYSGSESNPSLLFGTYNVAGLEGQSDATLAFNDLSSATTPEPSAFVLLATGLVGVGFLLRRRLPARP